ncbi:hypothetical protein OAK47_02360 [Planctomycetaceae bacterium]|jgi:hypothetical protein|nr:hypothetical protein [Planctomycetaceae bacterium]MDC0262045.1 hypothetical protein [Planctomycetaceae bacterium]MDC0273500.1 hypothetical protein [Planctomycetaceae bacterium]
MVRETRFSFDGDPHQRPDTAPEDFTEEDDLFLDAFSAPTARDKSAKTRPSRRSKRSGKLENPTSGSDQAREDRRGHLADADWLNPPKQKGNQTKRKSA